MEQERRQHRRFRFPLEGNWRGASGGVSCRIADISRGGCFVSAMSVPQSGEVTFVTIRLPGGAELTLRGTVTSPERGVGFGFSFDPLSPEDAATLERSLEEIERKLSS